MKRICRLLAPIFALFMLCVMSISASAVSAIDTKVTYSSTGTVYLKLIPDEGNTIYYTTDGTKPTVSSKEYTKKISSKKQLVVRAIEVNENGKTVASLKKTIKPRCASPKLSQECFSTYIKVHVEAVFGAECYYTIDGSKPTMESSRLYGDYIRVEENCTVKVLAVKNGFKNSKIASIDATGILTDDEFIGEVFRLVNIEREKEGLDAYTQMPELTAAAAVRAEEISRSYSHTRPDGTTCFTAFEDVPHHMLGENIAAGYISPQDVVEGWMNSPGHRANILSSGFTDIGIGFYRTESGYKTFWVQVFRG